MRPDELPGTHWTWSSENGEHQHVDTYARQYLRCVGTFPQPVEPIRTTGDGNCLLNALSLALYGNESFAPLLRRKLHHELSTNLSWYRKSGFLLSPTDWDGVLAHAARPCAWLELAHIFVMANVLRRPLILYGATADKLRYGQGEGGVTATFLPFRRKPSVCHGRPLALMWQSRYFVHYVPLVRIEGYPDFEWPLPQLAFTRYIGKTAVVHSQAVREYVHYDRPPQHPPPLQLDDYDLSLYNHTNAAVHVNAHPPNHASVTVPSGLVGDTAIPRHIPQPQSPLLHRHKGCCIQ